MCSHQGGKRDSLNLDLVRRPDRISSQCRRLDFLVVKTFHYVGYRGFPSSTLRSFQCNRKRNRFPFERWAVPSRLAYPPLVTQRSRGGFYHHTPRPRVRRSNIPGWCGWEEKILYAKPFGNPAAIAEPQPSRTGVVATLKSYGCIRSSR